MEDCLANNRKRFLGELQGFANVLVSLEESCEILIKVLRGQSQLKVWAIALQKFLLLF